jgi:DNA-binding LacI/PurR family transcriptional regulator
MNYQIIPLDELCARLERVMHDRNRSISEVSEETGISKSTISRYLGGDAGITFPTQVRLSSWIGEPVTKSTGDALQDIHRTLQHDPNLTPTARTAVNDIMKAGYWAATRLDSRDWKGEHK